MGLPRGWDQVAGRQAWERTFPACLPFGTLGLSYWKVYYLLKNPTRSIFRILTLSPHGLHIQTGTERQQDKDRVHPSGLPSHPSWSRPPLLPPCAAALSSQPPACPLLILSRVGGARAAGCGILCVPRPGEVFALVLSRSRLVFQHCQGTEVSQASLGLSDLVPRGWGWGPQSAGTVKPSSQGVAAHSPTFSRSQGMGTSEHSRAQRPGQAWLPLPGPVHAGLAASSGKATSWGTAGSSPSPACSRAQEELLTWPWLWPNLK